MGIYDLVWLITIARMQGDVLRFPVVCTVYLELCWDHLRNFPIMILIAFMWARIPLGPDSFRRVIKYQTLRTSFHGGFESVANI